MAKWYGNVTNRLEEGNNYNKDNLIHVGDDVTEYLYSDRNCYFVTEVKNQKNILIKQYYVCADHSKKGGMGHQDWMYFKTADEYNQYLRSFGFESNAKERKEIELKFRYGKWKQVIRCGETCKYYDFNKISFGVRDYYYDWEF